MQSKVSVAVIGCGNWGKNHVNTIGKIPGADLQFICDDSPVSLEKNVHAGVSGKRTASYQEVLNSDVSSVIIATPVASHYELAKLALLSGKHVLVEKPMCTRTAEAKELVEIAQKKGLVLMVGHLMYYHPTLQELKRRIDQGEFGRLFFVRSERLNPGIVRNFENVWESLAPHDLSILLWLFGSELESLSASGKAYLQKEICVVSNAVLSFKNGTLGYVSVSWLDPVKTRRLTVVGEKKMAVFNDLPGGGLEIFNTRAVANGAQFKFEHTGSEIVPLSSESALKVEQEHFLECVRKGATPLTDGQNGLTVLEWMTQGTQQLKRKEA